MLLGLFHFLSAQNNYHIQQFTTDNGLPSNGIKGLQWDAGTGFLWIATEAGITRYNGTDFRIFSRNNTPGLYSERMLFLLKARDGRIYTSDEVGNLFFVMKNKLQFVGQAIVDTRPSTFKLIGLVSSGALFRQSANHPPANFGFKFLGEQLLPMSETHLLLTHYDSLFDYQLGNPNPAFQTTMEHSSRLCFVGGALLEWSPRHGFFRIDTISFHRTPLSAAPAITMQGHTQLFWDNGMKQPILVNGRNAWLLDFDGRQISGRLICTTVPTNILLGFAQYDDKNNLLFLGSNSKGIFVIRHNSVRSVKKYNPYPQDPTASYSQIALSGDAILTNQGDVLGSASVHKPAAIHTPFNNFVHYTADSTLWYSRDDTILSWSRRTGRTQSIPAGAGSITDGFVESGGNLYVANAIGIGQIKQDSVQYQFRYPKADINSNAPFAMQEISPGVIAIATCEGLFQYKTGSRQLDTLWRVPGICVRALWKYEDYLFIGTYGRGIFLYKNSTIKHIPSDKNNYLQYAHCFMPDNAGFCWISTNHGLFRARPQDMIDAFEKNVSDIYYHYYGRQDGMEMTELNGGCTPCALALNDTTLSFPSMDGLVWVDPTRQLIRLPEGSIYIDAFIADGQAIDLSSLMHPELPAGSRELSFSLGFPAWSNKENLYIEYRLDPYSKDWQILELQNDPRLKFSNLPSGNYTLELRKTTGFEHQYTTTRLSFSIARRWYQQPWWQLAGLLLLTGIIAGIIRWRTHRFTVRQNNLEKQIAEKTQQLQKKNEELEKTDNIKTRLISIISHDLITPLKFLHLTGKGLTEKKEQLSDSLQQEAIAEITNTAKELELLSTNILNWIKYQNEDRRLAKEAFQLHALVNQLFGILAALARQKQIQLINEVSEELTLYQYIEPVKIVLYNLLLNGINFTSEGHIRVSSVSTRDTITISIEDTGVGMSREQINNIMADHFIISSANVDNRKGNGLGYLIIKDLLKIMRGQLYIQSEKEKGARVDIRIPLS